MELRCRARPSIILPPARFRRPFLLFPIGEGGVTMLPFRKNVAIPIDGGGIGGVVITPR